MRQAQNSGVEVQAVHLILLPQMVGVGLMIVQITMYFGLLLIVNVANTILFHVIIDKSQIFFKRIEITIISILFVLN